MLSILAAAGSTTAIKPAGARMRPVAGAAPYEPRTLPTPQPDAGHCRRDSSGPNLDHCFLSFWSLNYEN
jgi:hypothetical protein